MEVSQDLKTLKFTTINALGGLARLAEFRLLDTLSLLSGERLRSRALERKFAPILRREVVKLWRWDAQNRARGLYPADIGPKFNPKEQAWDFIRILADYPKVLKRKKEHRTKLATGDYPDYFARTFHFQSGGYLSRDSAELYDEQVEILFGGTADIMRRSLLVALKDEIQSWQKSGSDVHILELAAGTGAGTRLLSGMLPQANYTLTDLSPYYVEYAHKKLASSLKIEAQALDASDTRLPAESYDLVFHIFLFHELPKNERVKVLGEMKRLLKPNGRAVIIDSIQLKDKPQFKEVLFDFPKRYHEPFYRNYLEWDMEGEIERAGLTLMKRSRHFLSTCLVMKK